jgi:hypothetical protein
MDPIRIYCSTCFAIPGEPCRTKYIVHGRGEVTPIICPPHSTRLSDCEKELVRHSLAQLLCAVALQCLEQNGLPR